MNVTFEQNYICSKIYACYILIIVLIRMLKCVMLYFIVESTLKEKIEWSIAWIFVLLFLL